MSILLPRSHPVILPFLYPSFSATFCNTSRRHESSARRTTKKLRTKPDPSFTAAIAPDKINDYIVFNPPSSSPSPYQTPPAFLPRDDPRRTLLSQTYRHANPYIDSSQRLPPLARKVQKEKKYHLTPTEMSEIRRLRLEDPNKWTRKTLSEKFGCSQFFVGMIAEASEEKKAKETAKLEEVKDRWGKRRRNAREDRGRRRELWAMDR